MIFWVLVDDKIGSSKQSLALSRSICNNTKHELIIKQIKYNSFIKFPNFIRQNTLLGVDLKKSDNIIENLPDIIIFAGRRLSSVALNIKKRNFNKTILISILNPNFNFKKFDLVILPKHDNYKVKYDNLVEMNGSLTYLNDNENTPLINKEKFNRPFVLFTIGGDTKNNIFDLKKFKDIVIHISYLISNIGGTLFITTSRRTNSSCNEILKKYIECDNYFYDWNEQNGNNNPYLELLKISDFIIATGDSISIISEICSLGKTIYVYNPFKHIDRKHKIFINDMLENGSIQLFDKNIMEFKKNSYIPLNETTRIANFIKEKYDL